MEQKLRFGVATLQDSPWFEMVERWQRLEALGLDSLMLADHFVNFANPSAPWFESWTLLSALATQTKTIRIGSLSAIPWRNPAFLARQALTVDHISNGRLDLGLGSGVPAAMDCSYAMTGTPDWPAGERVERFREVVEIVDQLLRNPVSSYEGRYYQLKDAAMSPAPVQKPRPPLMIGAQGPRMLNITARYADTWNTFGGFARTSEEMLADTRKRSALLDAYCAEIRRDPQTLRRSLLVYGVEGERMFSSMDAFEEVFKRYREIGITEFIIYYPFMPPMIPIFEHIVTEVIPRLRETG